MTLIDTHCHLNFDSYAHDREAVLARAVQAGVTRIIIPAIDLVTGQQIADLCRQHSCLFGAVGIHPNSAADFQESDLEQVRALAQQPSIVAIGEIGLDYYWDKCPPATQRRAFEAQLSLAAQLRLPVIIHNREAGDDVIAILETWVNGLPDELRQRPGVLHSFSASSAVAERALAAGFFLGFTGPITFKNADETRRIAAETPLERLLVETDGPFLAPVPFRGQRNEPSYIPYIIDRLAQLHGITPDEIGQITTANAVRLFQLTEPNEQPLDCSSDLE